MVITSKIQRINVWDLGGNNISIVKKCMYIFLLLKYAIDDEEQKVVSLSWDPFNEGRFISASGGCITLWDTSMDRQGLTLKNSNNVQFIKYNNKRQEYIASGLQNG